ncbi:MAG: hypothetical protein WBM53_00540, partial [Maribacter sp.]
VMGRVDIALVNSENAIISWMGTNDTEAQIMRVKVHKSGKIGVPVIISRLDASRKTGFPQRELVKDKVYFAWTDLSDDLPLSKRPMFDWIGSPSLYIFHLPMHRKLLFDQYLA